ncbi:Eco57I restriction-modification methylase domain-containing protein [Ornithinimicrobium sp. INDO-MA30-4]|uniref:Eco57I restriction-modification methylase domain-containing protein n=1 Tax=Ornithinimicrobium sp. INDO-MA30-4 TaxID=2908651 RepID=UPI001F31F176|nr:Eco57I restriction-modification methylase domain-containing protein [Ornithinimicrobium sp. INDO-MA30-4]UJH71733.1 Eco57I restriction-modification methylase domain-containing protein [Ornithinimicrobium sp. INDO-MA30-4]
MTIELPTDLVAHGEIFTKRWVVEAILDLVGYTVDTDLSGMVLVEPSVGDGAFLGPTVDRLSASALEHGVAFASLSGVIRGYDLQAKHVQSSQTVVRDRLVANGADLQTAATLATTWISQADFLLDDVDTPANFVVGNPPYIRSDDLARDLGTAYRDRWATMRGRADVYVGFFERALGMLKPDGKLGYICADRWMRNAYGANLRDFITTNYAVESLWQMHDVDAFATEVSAYPAITILGNHPQSEVAVLDATATFTELGAREATHFVRSTDNEASGVGWSGARLDSWFSGTGFWPTGTPERLLLLEFLQENFPKLEETGGTTKIGIGVATGADKAYVVAPTADVEPDRLLPLVMADDIRSGQLQTPQKVLINPWNEQGNLVDLSAYPRLKLALASHPNVVNRYVAKKKPAAWYRTIDKVSPGLAHRPKLLFQDMKAQITPVFEPGGYYPHHNLYYIVSTEWDLEVLGGLMLSRIAQAFIEAYGVRMRGGTLRFQSQYLRKIRVPAPQDIPEAVANRLRDAHRASDRDAATRAAEEAYGLPVGVL